MDKKIIDFNQNRQQIIGLININASYKNAVAVNFDQKNGDYIMVKTTDPDTGAQLYKKAAELIKRDRKKYVAAANSEGDLWLFED